MDLRFIWEKLWDSILTIVLISLVLVVPMMLFWNYVVVLLIPTVAIGFMHSLCITLFITTISKLR